MAVLEFPKSEECLVLERLEAEIVSMAADLAAAEAQWILWIAEYDRREGWATWGCRSCAHWLSWKCGSVVARSPGTATNRPRPG